MQPIILAWPPSGILPSGAWGEENGKHYPFDIVIGACTGWLAGFGLSRIFTYLWNRKSDGRFNFIGLFKKVPGNTN